MTVGFQIRAKPVSRRRMDAAEAIHQKFVARMSNGNLPRRTSDVRPSDIGLGPEAMVELFYSQVASRQMDRLSRKLQARGEGFYTIGSSGHENNAAVADALRADDMAFLHYRSNAFQIHRSKKLPGQTPLWDMLLSFAASAEDPISGGRHKVIGSKPLAIPPQTSTIASGARPMSAGRTSLVRRGRLPLLMRATNFWWIASAASIGRRLPGLHLIWKPTSSLRAAKRRSNPVAGAEPLDRFASLAMTGRGLDLTFT